MPSDTGVHGVEAIQAGAAGARSTASNHTGRLILAPGDPQVCPDRDQLIRTLLEAGFIAGPIADRECAFQVGAEFLDLITFVGCAVSIATDPVTGSAFCHVLISPATVVPRWCHGRNTRAPRCPGCRSRRADWQSHNAQWTLQPDDRVACPSCGQSHALWQWDWKQQAGFGRQLIEIEEVFPGEAVPTPELLNRLERASGCAWGFFFVQD